VSMNLGSSRRSTNRIDSMKHALRGIGVLLKSQQNAQFHAVAAFLVVLAGIVLQLSAWEWAVTIVVIAVVWVAEALNTAIEFLVDLVSPSHQPLAGKVKDISAGAVLIAAIGAVTVGVIIFGRHLQGFLLT
jgi:diacylglycerol kinase